MKLHLRHSATSPLTIGFGKGAHTCVSSLERDRVLLRFADTLIELVMAQKQYPEQESIQCNRLMTSAIRPPLCWMRLASQLGSLLTNLGTLGRQCRRTSTWAGKSVDSRASAALETALELPGPENKTRESDGEASTVGLR